MISSPIGQLISLATQFGVFEFYLPFLILFSLLYGLLSKVKLFGDPFNTTTKRGEAKTARAINLIFSLAAALFLMAYTPIGFTLTSFFSTMFTGTTMVLVTLVCAGLIIYLLAKMAGFDLFSPREGKDGKMIWDVPPMFRFLIIIVALGGIGLFILSGGFGFLGLGGIGGLPSLGGIQISTQDIMIIALIVITAIALWWVVRSPKEEKEKA